MQKPSIPEGTRDFGPEQVRRRTYIFDTIRAVFVKFGFQPLETPAMEKLSTLTGKYGDEGDKLLFKILNNGDYLKDADKDALIEKNSARLLSSIAKRGLRYDLTVPFARYVAMHRSTLAFPFKRYQIQPVWRADSPQRGRYREFFQCDADMIGSNSLQYEAELVQIYDEVFTKLKIPVVIKINNRKVLYGIAEAAGIADQFLDMTVAVDKLDKIGIEGVRKELIERGISQSAIISIERTLSSTSLQDMMEGLNKSPTGIEGLSEIVYVLKLLSTNLENEIKFDPTLARGLSYYTGCIFEVSALDTKMGSIGGGGRYANLTEVFGVPNMSGVGISFGAERIYDIMVELDLFPESLSQEVQIMLVASDKESFDYSFECVTKLRAAGISAELYPEPGTSKKMYDYVLKRSIPLLSIIKKDETKSSRNFIIKDQKTWKIETLSIKQIVRRRQILDRIIRPNILGSQPDSKKLEDL